MAPGCYLYLPNLSFDRPAQAGSFRTRWIISVLKEPLFQKPLNLDSGQPYYLAHLDKVRVLDLGIVVKDHL
jgi:hypothetical protein